MRECHRLSPKALDWMLFLFPVLLSLPFAATPLGRDQGYFAYGGWRMVHGEMPHRDFWTNTFPGVFLWYMLMELVPLVPRAVWNGAVIGLTSVLLSRVIRGRGGMWAGLGYGAVCPLFHRFWDIGQAEHLVNLFVVAGVHVSHAYAGGMLLGAAFLCKPVSLLFLPVLWRGVGEAAFRRAAFQAAGMVFPVGAWIALYALGGGIESLWEDLVVFNAAYGASTWNAELVGRAVRGVIRWGAPLWPAVVCAGVGLVRGPGRMGPWFACAVGAVLVQGKLFTYHWIIALAPLMALAGSGIGDLAALRREVRGVVILAAVLPWLILPGRFSAAWYPAAVEAWRGIRYLTRTMTSVEYLEGFGDKRRGGDFSASEQRLVAEEIVRRGCGTAVVWGFEPGLNYLSRTPNPLRYVADFPLTFPVSSPFQDAVRRRHRDRFVSQLLSTRPGCIVIVRNDANPVEAVDSHGQMLEFAEFAALLRSGYRGPVSLGTYDLWEAR